MQMSKLNIYYCLESVFPINYTIFRNRTHRVFNSILQSFYKGLVKAKILKNVKSYQMKTLAITNIQYIYNHKTYPGFISFCFSIFPNESNWTVFSIVKFTIKRTLYFNSMPFFFPLILD